MFDKKKYDACLTLAARSDMQLWAAQLETAVTLPMRTAGTRPRKNNAPASRDSLLAHAAVSALGNISRRLHFNLLDRAVRFGAEKTRLEIRVSKEVVGAFYSDGDSGLRVTRRLRKTLEKTLEIFDWTFDPIPNHLEDKTSITLLRFAERAILPESYLPAKYFAPTAVCVLGADEPLTPDTFTQRYQEQQHA